MKLMKFGNYAFLFVTALGLMFTSCSKNDEPGDEGNGPGNPEVTGSRVSKIVLDFGEGSMETKTFTYDKRGQLLKTSTTWNDGHYKGMDEQTFTRVGNNLVIDHYESEDGKETRETYSCKLNADGYVASLNKPDSETTSFTYKNGYLAGCSTPDEDTYTFTWQDGNLIKSVSEDQTENITYTDKVNNMNIDMLDIYGIEPFDELSAFTSGYFGKGNKNLVKEIYDGDTTRGNSVEYAYEFDKDGQVTGFTLVEKEWWPGNVEVVHASATITYVTQ